MVLKSKLYSLGLLEDIGMANSVVDVYITACFMFVRQHAVTPQLDH